MNAGRSLRWWAGSAVVGLALAAPAAVQPAGERPVARITGGAIRGITYGPGAAFMGLPFAAPPVGPLRWKPPAPVVPWTGVREAAVPPFDAFQPDEGWNHSLVVHASEDCLFLNVVTPAWPMKGRLPVVVFIHGGGNFAGGGWEHPAIGVTLQAQGIVLVTINYRLGIFGFFAHPGLTAESPRHASGNYGLMDCLAALRWVRENIDRFGGDPQRVSVMGQSAGALDILLLMASPEARGLFARAIVESAPGVGPARLPDLADAQKKGAAFAESLGCPSIGALRALSAAALLAQAERARLRGSVVVDGWVLTEAPALTFAAGREARIPLVIGTNARESLFKGTADELRKAIADRYGSLGPQAEALYLGPGAPVDSPSFGDPGAEFLTDSVFRLPTLLVAQWHAASGAPTWLYLFDQVPKGREFLGASHSSEIAYAFGEMDSPAPRGVTYGPLDRAASAEMSQRWAAFAGTGAPDASGWRVWPEFEVSGQSYLDLRGSGSRFAHGLRAPYLELFRRLYGAQMNP